MRFIRKDMTDGAIETLTICRLDTGVFFADCLEAESPYVVQIEAGTPDDLGDFVGLYDLDGERIEQRCTWEVASDVPAEVREAVEEGWASGSNTVEPVA